MKSLALGISVVLFGFGESLAAPAMSCPANALDSRAGFGESLNPLAGNSETLVIPGEEQLDLPGLNRKARRISRKSRRHTLGKTRGSAAKTRGAVKKRGRGYEKASRRGFDRANKRAAPKKKAGCKS